MPRRAKNTWPHGRASGVEFLPTQRPLPANEEPFVADLGGVEPFAVPPRPARDPYAARRYRADHFCLWMACGLALCRRAHACHGPRAECVLLHKDVQRPLLDEIVQATFGPR